MYSCQASTLNHPAGISYLKRKETSHRAAFHEQHCLLHCWHMHKPVRESPGPPSIPVDSTPSQSTVGLAQQRCTAAPQPTRGTPELRGKGPRSGVSLAQHITTYMSTRRTPPPTSTPQPTQRGASRQPSFHLGGGMQAVH